MERPYRDSMGQLLLVARDCRENQPPQLDAGEMIENTLITFDEFVDLGTNDRFEDHILKLYILSAYCAASKEALGGCIWNCLGNMNLTVLV